MQCGYVVPKVNKALVSYTRWIAWKPRGIASAGRNVATTVEEVGCSMVDSSTILSHG